eukprot:TRINITY_DN12381_c0_g1_i1.p3 TRINITY_DN12381_c0_g1~~TRINITY_DN12381_c0_g1_i1.p3  ORF type:complete len:152 (+),score=22.40 TRINITY_DN12381_c0_g1_i1:671-1126(+)
MDGNRIGSSGINAEYGMTKIFTKKLAETNVICRVVKTEVPDLVVLQPAGVNHPKREPVSLILILSPFRMEVPPVGKPITQPKYRYINPDLSLQERWQTGYIGPQEESALQKECMNLLTQKNPLFKHMVNIKLVKNPRRNFVNLRLNQVCLL